MIYDPLQPYPPPSDPATPGEDSDTPGAATRAALVRTALDLFGRNGFSATSTRDIARAAGVNIAGIAYHFGGKAGLHQACAEAIATTFSRIFTTFGFDESIADENLDADAAVARFKHLSGQLARFLLARPEAESIARFMVREQMDPTSSFPVLYETLIRPRHERMCRLWARATGAEATSEQVVLEVSALFGQIMFFRVGRATALRRLGWDVIDDVRAEKILAVVHANIDAAFVAHRARRTLP